LAEQGAGAEDKMLQDLLNLHAFYIKHCSAIENFGWCLECLKNKNINDLQSGDEDEDVKSS